MFYFIPAWYQNERPWYDTTPFWFRVFERMNFDDTVSHVKLFYQAGEASCLLLLNYQPQLRYFLHKQGVQESPYWSFFDDIQNITKSDTTGISFKELNWPEGTDFLYSPFAIVARCQGQTIAHIHFAENGNLLRVDFQEAGRTNIEYFFDDRGFLSSLLYYDEEGRPHHQDYLNANGVWQVREDLTGQGLRLTINPQADQTFQKSYYTSWQELISERLQRFQEKEMTVDDAVIIASHPQHNSIAQEIFYAQKRVFSFFGQRQDMTDQLALQAVASAANFLVVDTKKHEEQLNQALSTSGESVPNILRISPFDARLRLGHSQTMKEQILYFHIDTIDQADLQEALKQLLDKMDSLPDLVLKLVTFHHQFPVKQWEDWLCSYLLQHYDRENFFQLSEDAGENQLEEEESWELFRIDFCSFSNEDQIIAALDKARLVIDLGESPDPYTQIASLSAGVPQIHRYQSDYVTHGENGWLITEMSDIREALDYYCIGLTNWNKSVVHTVQKMADYTSGRLLHKWKTLLEKD